jgi:hypothetical protein
LGWRPAPRTCEGEACILNDAAVSDPKGNQAMLVVPSIGSFDAVAERLLAVNKRLLAHSHPSGDFSSYGSRQRIPGDLSYELERAGLANPFSTDVSRGSTSGY